MTKVDLIAEAERSIDAIDHFMDGTSLDTDEFAKLVRIRLDCLEFLADMNTATETSPTNLPRALDPDETLQSPRRNYEVVKSKQSPDRWHVEFIDHANEGECYVTVFTGPDAEERAREYARLKNLG